MMLVKNSHDEWKEAKQADKAILPLAMTKIGHETKLHMVKLLNEANDFVREVHASGIGKRMLKGRSHVPWNELLDDLFAQAERSLQQVLVHDEQQDNSEETQDSHDKPKKPKRSRKKPERFGFEEHGSENEGENESKVLSDDEVDNEYGSEELVHLDKNDAMQEIKVSPGLGLISTPFKSAIQKKLRSRLMALRKDQQERIPQQ